MKGVLPKRRLLLPDLARRYPLARAFLAPVSGTGPRSNNTRPLLTYPLPSATRTARTWSRTHRKHYGRPHGRPRGTV